MRFFTICLVESIIHRKLENYYEAIAKSNNEGKSDKFIDFMLSVIIQTTIEFIQSLKIEKNILTSQAKKLIKIMKKGRPYSTLELMSKMGMKSRISFKKNYLDKLIRAGVVQMTIPQTPSNKNQQYIRK